MNDIKAWLLKMSLYVFLYVKQMDFLTTQTEADNCPRQRDHVWEIGTEHVKYTYWYHTTVNYCLFLLRCFLDFYDIQTRYSDLNRNVTTVTVLTVLLSYLRSPEVNETFKPSQCWTTTPRQLVLIEHLQDTCGFLLLFFLTFFLPITTKPRKSCNKLHTETDLSKKRNKTLGICT